MVWFDLRCHSMIKITKKKYEATSDKREMTKNWDEDVTSFILPLPSHTDSFWPCLSQPLEFKLVMKWFVSTETTKLKYTLRLKETFILVRELKTLFG